jgi:putative spermidine/putrescine transport system substrate-binding protein
LIRHHKEPTAMLDRRHVLTSALTLGALHAFPGLSRAQARLLVFATFTGSWEEAHKDVLVPAFRKANNNAEMTLDPMLSVDQIAKVKAALNNPPIDVMLHDPGPALVAIDQGLVENFPVAASANYKDLIADAQVETGPAPFFQVVGITYNPEKIKTPPTSWADIWKPEFKGRVGLTNLNSTLGTGWLVEIARMRGGSEANVDAAFKAIEELKPNLAAVAANPGALATLYQQGQIDIGPGNFNAIQILKARGVPVEFVAPKEGAIAFKTTMHIVKNSPNAVLAAKLIDAALSPEVQGKLMDSPYLIVPTNTKVKMAGEIAKVLAKDHDDMKKKFVFQDWKKINEQRASWIEKFNRDIKI